MGEVTPEPALAAVEANAVRPPRYVVMVDSGGLGSR